MHDRVGLIQTFQQKVVQMALVLSTWIMQGVCGYRLKGIYFPKMRKHSTSCAVDSRVRANKPNFTREPFTHFLSEDSHKFFLHLDEFTLFICYQDNDYDILPLGVPMYKPDTPFSCHLKKQTKLPKRRCRKR